MQPALSGRTHTLSHLLEDSKQPRRSDILGGDLDCDLFSILKPIFLPQEGSEVETNSCNDPSFPTHQCTNQEAGVGKS